MGAQIQVEGRQAIVQGRPYLTGAPVVAPDLQGCCRAAAGGAGGAG